MLCETARNSLQLAATRVGVGTCEAGSSPPSHSMIANFYPPEDRATAIFATGANMGILVGFLTGGWISQLHGWRAAFFIAGLPGLLLAVWVRFSLREPPRGHSEARTSEATDQAAPSVWTAFAFMRNRRSLRHIVIGTTLN
ncbi:MAG: MFS transporter [bacterium]|nr:MFS transporter [bacterium]